MFDKLCIYCVREKPTGRYVSKSGHPATKSNIASYSHKGSATLLVGGAAWARVCKDIWDYNMLLGDSWNERQRHPEYNRRSPQRDDPDVIAMRETFEVVELELP